VTAILLETYTRKNLPILQSVLFCDCFTWL